MQEITLDARAKINIGLDVTGRRADGYHMVRMIMQSVDLCDTVTVQKTATAGITMTTDDGELPVDEHNLCVKAAKLLAEEFDFSEGIQIHLKKRIPVAAGMAGGSTDAAAVLVAVNKLFSLGLSKEDLMKRSVSIGADVPYCILGGTALAEGIGEELTPMPAMMDYPILIAKPDIAVSTKYVYEHLDALEHPTHPDIDQMIHCIEKQDMSGLGQCMGNILQDVTVVKYPVIDEIKQLMVEEGAIVSMMSGSGPTVFGFFADEETRDKALEAMKVSGLASWVEATRIWQP